MCGKYEIYLIVRVSTSRPSDSNLIRQVHKKRLHNYQATTIDLMLQCEIVKWRISGKNSMVRVSEEAICLGVLDGGLNPRTSIVLRGYQLEDTLLEFDVGTSC